MGAGGLRPGVVPVATLGALAAWALGVAAAAWTWDTRFRADASTGLQRATSAVLAAWVLEGLALSVLAAIGAAITPAAALAPLAPALLVARRRITPSRPTTLAATPLGMVAVVLLGCATTRFALHLWQWPWGQPWSWDVYAVWGFKARFLAATGGLWRYLGLGSVYPFSSADYPPLLSAQLAAVSWPAADARHAAIPDVVLLAAAAVLLFELWRALAGPVAAASLTLLLVWPAFPLSGALVGLADRPLALLAAVATTLLLAPPERRDPRLLTVCFLGLALLKNEGLPFATVLAVAAWLVGGRRRAALAPALALIPAATWHLVAAASGFASARLAGFTLPTELGSPGAALSRAASGLATVPDWTVSLAAAALGALALLCVPTLRWVAVALLTQVGVVTVALMAGPYPLSWQISTALPRLLVQLVPSGLACLAAAVGHRGARTNDVVAAASWR
jgi:hypothetical protein